MITPQELRIGNLLTSDGEICVVDEIRNDFIGAGALGIYSAGFDDDFYIPLTEEWLLKFGCKNLGTCHWETPNGIQFNFHQENNCGVICFGPRHVNFWHVHTFQNIIATTGKELELTPSTV